MIEPETRLGIIDHGRRRVRSRLGTKTENFPLTNTVRVLFAMHSLYY